jgi:hypothetical protein
MGNLQRASVTFKKAMRPQQSYRLTLSHEQQQD